MRLPLSWLHDYVRPELSAAQLAQRLAMTGTEVDRIHHHGVRSLDRFVVGRVLDAVQHPDADRLRVCQVDVGDGGPQTIVCGAPNVAAGQTVAVARPGAVMPDGTKLGAAKLRGVESAGMILAEDELGIGTDHAGILVLDGELAPGTPLSDVLAIATEVLELEITPNRPDCLGVYGVAREVHAATGAPLAPPPWADDHGTLEPATLAEAAIVVEVAELCPRFTARVFEDVRIGASPQWLKARLMAAGQRPINNVVDITNYVMLLTGQPLHAFDLDRVAGVMGGARSEVHAGTTRVLMEVATWNGPNINRTMTKLGLRTEAGGRFEKGLAPEQAMEAQAVATRLMLDITGALLVPGTIDVGGPGRAPRMIRLRDARVAGLLGTTVDRARSREVLESLGFGVADAEDGLDVTVPAFRRNDVTREADVIEEVARLAVLDHLPATLPRSRTGHAGLLTPAQRLRRRALDALVGCGLYEAVGWSFTDPGVVERLGLPSGDPRADLVTLENPMSEDQSVMRSTLLGSLLDVVRHNRHRGRTELGVFEYGAVYRAHGRHDEQAPSHPGGDRLPAEVHALGALLTGDFFAAKAVLEAVGSALRADLSVESAPEPFLHPGRSARVLAGGDAVGWLGEVHPTIAARRDLEQVAAFEIDLDAVIAHADPAQRYRDLTSFPELRLDLAVVVGTDVPAARVIAAVRAAGGENLVRAEVFDVYTGEQVGSGRKSLALHLGFRAADRTLTDDDVAPLRAAIVAGLRDELGGELRA